MPDNIYDVKVGDKLTRDQILEAAGVPSSQTKNEEVVIAEETAKDEDNKDEGTPTQDDLDASRDYRYPLDMSSNYPAHIVFTVKKIEGANFFDATGIKKVVADTKAYFDAAEDESVADEATTPEERQQIKADSNQKQPETVSYENNTGGIDLGTITLPLMSPLRYADIANYNSSAQLGILGGVAEDVLQGRNPFAGAMSSTGGLKKAAGALAGQMLANSVGALAGAATGGILGKGLGAVGLGGFVGANLGEGIGVASKSATRIAAAPNFRTIFENVGIRPFSFDFKMIATSAREAQEIKNIIKMFRTELYPEMIPIGASGVPLAYKFPNVFEISVRNRYNAEPGFKFQRCYLKDVTTTFNETAQTLYNDGEFIEVSLSLQFIEIVALNKQKVRQGY